jgi:hypothetical protein
MGKKSKTYPWADLPDEELLELRFCDLDLKLEDSRLEPLIETLYKDLEKKGINFKPHVWISEDWFSMDGIPGIAVPFYIVHKRLGKLCTKFGLEAEGLSHSDALKLLRHESGHAIDNAFKLRLIRQRQKLFGLSSMDYPESYVPNKEAACFVSHLNPWYAQAHPDEDWAETFATWLTPNSNWKKVYQDSHALVKLYFMDEVMKGLNGKVPLVQKNQQPGNINFNRRKLKTFFTEKMESLKSKVTVPWMIHVGRLFDVKKNLKKSKLISAQKFMIENKYDFAQKIALWTGHNSYTILQNLNEIESKCEDLYLVNSYKETEIQMLNLMTALITQSTLSGHMKILM